MEHAHPGSLGGAALGSYANTLTAEPKNSEFKGNDGEELFVDGTLVEIPIRVAPDAQPGLYEISVRGEGIFQGQAVERRARVFYGSLRSLRGEPTFDQKMLLDHRGAAVMKFFVR